ncbi:hypothetical protein ACLKA7_003555 [Drosophila subpalustris]
MKSRNTDTGKTTSGLCPTPRDDHWPAQPQQRSTTAISGANGQANCCLRPNDEANCCNANADDDDDDDSIGLTKDNACGQPQTSP